MKNLRGSVATLLAAIVVASVANQANAQLPPPGLAGSMPLSGPGMQQGVIMPPPQAMAQFSNAGMVGQTPPAGYMPAGYGPPGYASPGYGPAAYGPGMGTQPDWNVQSASYAPPQPFPTMNGMAVPAGYEMGGSYGGEYAGGGCASCGGGGCDACMGPGGSGFGARFISRLLPYAEGGPCAPRWYDITMDALYLNREKASRTVNFASDGINGDIVLSTDDLDFDQELGYRLTAAHQIFAGATMEFTYFGLLDWSSSATVIRAPGNFSPPPNPGPAFVDDLYSVLSNYGTDPIGGFDETDRSRQQSLAYTSSVDNFELNVRKRFTAPNCRLQYSWLAGARYLYLVEDFTYATLGGDADAIAPGLQSRGLMNYNVGTRNSLTGLQVGGDAWLNLVPGVNIGADIKAGVYGNYANQTTNILATTTIPAVGTTYRDALTKYDIALATDANLYFMWRLGPHWTLRAGYNFMFVDGVALAPENFNSVPPNVLTGGASSQPRITQLNRNGNVFYHGGFGGLEFMW